MFVLGSGHCLKLFGYILLAFWLHTTGCCFIYADLTCLSMRLGFVLALSGISLL